MTIEGGTMDGKLKISDTLSLPYEAVTETFAILAKRGKGKTYAASVMAEEMIAAGMPVVVIDPLGVWWGLRSSADGKSDGLPVVIFGGEHADVPLDEGSGSMIADVIVDQRFSAIVDLLLLSKAARRRFMAAFLERLYFLNREALHVFVDEADMFAPQSTGGAENAHVLGAMEDMVRRGRSRGIGVTMITQRPAVLNKDVLTQAEVLIAMGMNGLRDVKAIDEWVRLHADEATAVEVKKSLPSLPVGTAWVWSPGLLDVLEKVKIRRRHTFDSSSTPKIGQVRQVPKTMAEIDVAALGEKIAATVERAKADDPRELKKRIRDMERELADALAKPPAVAEVEVPVVPDGLADRIKGVAEIMTRAAVTTEEIYEWLSSEGFQQKMRDISVAGPHVPAAADDEPVGHGGPLEDVWRHVVYLPVRHSQGRVRGRIGRRLAVDRRRVRLPGRPTGPDDGRGVAAALPVDSAGRREADARRLDEVVPGLDLDRGVERAGGFDGHGRNLVDVPVGPDPQRPGGEVGPPDPGHRHSDERGGGMSAAQILVWVVIVFAASVAVGMLYEAQTKEKGSGAPVWFGCLVVGYVILFVVASRG
jgi:hypothetical protein